MEIAEKIRNYRFIWIIGLVITLLVITVPLVVFIPRAIGGSSSGADSDDAWASVLVRKQHTDHSALLTGEYISGPEVTLACLECHEDSADEMLKSVHFTWLSEPAQATSWDEPVAMGKKNLLNNFCIGIQSNWTGCTTCHAGYGWSDDGYDFSAAENVDCLICHADTGLYAKSKSGLPAEGIDLAAAAGSVRWPTRDNCGYCHFDGGGGNAVKHGDLDEHLYNPPPEMDVHMGELNFQCIDCHPADDHIIRGRSISVSVENTNQVYCTDCHVETPHEEERLNDHTDSVACQTCHIPTFAIGDPTKMIWDWSTAGQNLPEEPHVYLKIKGSFIYEDNVVPQYYWYNGKLADRYLLGDKIDPSTPTLLNPLDGDINDPEARIMPFKVHLAKQPYDTVNNYLLQPQTVGEYWVNFDWDVALRAGSEMVGLPYSGQYGFAETEMVWPITHLVRPAEDALQCNACHSEDGRLDWTALGYSGDPLEWGGR